MTRRKPKLMSRPEPNGPTEMTQYEGTVMYCLAWGIVGDDKCRRCKKWYELGDEVFAIQQTDLWDRTLCKDCLVKEIW